MDHQDVEQLVDALRAAARQMASTRSMRDLEQTLAQIVASAVDTVPGADEGSVSMTRDGHVDTRNPTTETIRKLDETQTDLNEGPCLRALDEAPAGNLVVAQNFAGADAQRWPRFAPYAVEAGYHGLLSTHLSADGGPRAALNLYAREPDAFGEHSRTLAGLFAVQAALLLYGADTAEHLQRAVDSRDLIGQAKGILMERFSLDDEGAFQLMVKSSQDTNMKLVTVAEWLTSEVGQRRARDVANGG